MKQFNLTKDKTNFIVMKSISEQERYYALIKVSDELKRDLERCTLCYSQLSELGDWSTINVGDREYVFFMHENLLGGESFRTEYYAYVTYNDKRFAYALLDDDIYSRIEHLYKHRVSKDSPSIRTTSDLSFYVTATVEERESDGSFLISTGQLPFEFII